MINPRDGHVSLLVQFPPREVRDAAERLALFLDSIEDVVMTLDARHGSLELANVRGVDLRALTDWLYRRGARCVFVRYRHEGQFISITYGSDDGRDPQKATCDRDAARLN